MVTTVSEQLEQASTTLSRYLDALVQKETTNATAKAQVLIDDIPFFDEPLSATALLALEGKLNEMREIYAQIPTLDLKEDWTWDPQNKRYAAKPRQHIKTEKQLRALVLYDATKEHPAQTKDYTQDVRIGVWTTKRFSGALPYAVKMELLERLDTLIRAVKMARQKANDEEVVDIHVAKKIFQYLHQSINQ
jgi:hypothetical protein